MNLHVYRCPVCPAWAPRIALQRSLLGPDSGLAPRCMAHAVPMPMVPVADHDTAMLPLEPTAQRPLDFVPLKVEHLKAAGIHLPETQDALLWLYRHRETNGMADAFRKVGGRRCIDLVAFAKLIRERK